MVDNGEDSPPLSPEMLSVNPPLSGIRIKGFLWKKHRKNKLWKGWHKRYFALTNEKLVYFKNEREMCGKAKARGEINLGADCTIVASPEGNGKLITKFMLLVPPGGMIHLGGTSKEDADEWIARIRDVIKEQKHEGSIRKADESSSSDEEEDANDDNIITEDDGLNSNNSFARQDSDIASGLASPVGKRERVQGTVTGAAKHGVLLKRKTGLFHGWHQRYFILRGNSLSYYRMDLKNNQNTLSAKCFRNSIYLTREFHVGYDKSRESEKKKREHIPFSVVGPRVSLNLSAKTQEEAQSWVEEIQKSIDAAPSVSDKGFRKVSDTSDGFSPDGKSVRSLRPSRAARVSGSPVPSSPSKGLHSRTNTVPSLGTIRMHSTPIKQEGTSPVSQASSSSPHLRINLENEMWNSAVLLEGWLWKRYVRKKYWMGWHLRYFMLSGNTLQYFKDGRKKRVIGSVVLGSDCCIDFPGSTIVVKKNKVLYPFTVFLDGPPHEQVSTRNALLLATPKQEDAKRWTESLRRSVYGPQSSENTTKFQLQDSDDEGEEEEEKDTAVRYGDKIRLSTRTAYDSKASPGVVQIFNKLDRSYFVVPPVGPAIAPELYADATFTVLNPCWPRNLSSTDKKDLKELSGFGEELRYGVKVLLADTKGRVWYQDGYYAFGKARSDIRETKETRLIFHRMSAGSREGDIVYYGQNNLLIEATTLKSKRLKPVRNYKKGSSRLVGGYINCNGMGKPIHFTILRDAESCAVNNSNKQSGEDICKMEVSVINSVTRETENSPIQLTPGSPENLGLLCGGIHFVSIYISGLSPEGKNVEAIEIPVPEIPDASKKSLASRKVVELKSLHPLGHSGRIFVSCEWECKHWWKSQQTPGDMLRVIKSASSFDTEWILLALFGMYSFFQTIITNEDGIFVVSVAMMILTLVPILQFLRGALTNESNSVAKGTVRSRHTGILSRGFWKLSATLVKKDNGSSSSVGSGIADAKHQNNEEEKRGVLKECGENPSESNYSYNNNSSNNTYSVDAEPRAAAAAMEGSTTTAEDPPQHQTPQRTIKGHVAAGSTLPYCPPSEEKMKPCSWTNSHFHNFKVRAGPNYRKLKIKKPSKRELFSLLSVDTIRTNSKIVEFTPYLKFKPEKVDKLIDLQARLKEKRPDLRIPPVFSVNLTWPTSAPPNPLWGKPIKDGPGIVFTLVFYAKDWWVDSSKEDVPALKLVSTWINSDLNSKYRERFKVLPFFVNLKECKIEGMVRTIVTRFNGKPFLSRPEHEFKNGVLTQINSKGQSVEIEYHNITVDGYRFPYLARSTCYSLLDNSSTYIIDMGFCIEAREDEEMPEQTIGHVRFNYLDHRLFPMWTPDVPSVSSGSTL